MSKDKLQPYVLWVRPSDAQVGFFSRKNDAPYKGFGQYPELRWLSSDQHLAWGRALNWAFQYARAELESVSMDLGFEILRSQIKPFSYREVTDDSIGTMSVGIRATPEVAEKLKLHPIIVSVVKMGGHMPLSPRDFDTEGEE